ncbi:MAG: hypothetical protein QME96_18685, partial [Myxococcota bacterium]|nr:hypothetical protein [Myxococcota bacterium]
RMGGALDEPTTGTPTPPETPPATTDEEDDDLASVWFWTTAGTAVALGIGAAVTGGLAYDTHNDFEASNNTRADLKDTGETLQLTTNILAAVAGAAAVAAVVLVFFTDFGGEEEPDEAAGGVTATLWPTGVVVTW